MERRITLRAVVLLAGLLAALAALSVVSLSQSFPKGVSVDLPKDVFGPPFGPTPRLSKPESGVIPGATVQRNEATGRIARVRGLVAVPNARDPEDAARRFLRAYARTLELAEDLRDLQLLQVTSSRTGHHVRFRQVLNNLPVLGGYVSVHLNWDGKVVLANLDTVPVKGTVGVPVGADPAQAVALALEVVKPELPPRVPPAASLAVYVEETVPTLVWMVQLDTRKPAGAWEVLVRVSDNKVLKVTNRARFVDGQGMVFLPNPVITSGRSDLQDNNDADTPVLNNERKSVTLRDLDGTGYLQGPYCTTEPTALQPRAREMSFQFNYTRSDDRFEEVMCYYHIDANQRYIQSLGFTNVNNRQQGVDVNGTDEDNAWYTPWTGIITYGTGGVDDAEDAHVIIHEYGHAIQDNQVPGFGQSHEAGSIGEGFSDYWAVTTFTGIGPRSPDWDVYVATWDAVSYNPGDPPFLRVLNSTKHYPEDIVGEVHADGEIWSACLWQIRGIVGQTRADTMILEAHFLLSPWATFEDNALAILQANRDLYGGADEAAILQVFVDRGILKDPRQTRLTVAAVVAAPGMDETLSAVLVREIDQSPIPGKAVDFTLDGTFIGSAVTNDEGRAELDFHVPDDALSGVYFLEASFAGDEEAFAAYGSAFLYVMELASISGTVTDSGTGMPDVTVTAYSDEVIGSANPQMEIPDADPSGIESQIELVNSGTVGDVEVSVVIRHTWIGGLRVGLIHPDGTMVLLHDMSGGSADDIVTTYPTLTAPAESLDVLRGKPLGGPWRLWVSDNFAMDEGILVSWSLRVVRETPLMASTTTDGEGRYTLANLEPGAWTVVPERGSSAFAPKSRTVSVAAGEHRTGVDFALNSFTIAGTVRHGTSPLPDVAVTLTSPAEHDSYYDDWPGTAIPDNNTTGIESPIFITDEGTLQNIRVWVFITHPYIGDLEVSIIHPDGTRVRLHNRTGGAADNLYTVYPDETRPTEPLSILFGKPITGTWKLRVRDLAIADQGTLDGWGLELNYMGTEDRMTTTGPDGRYSFADCIAGVHKVRASKPGHPFTPDVATVVVGPHRYDVDFQSLAKAARLDIPPISAAVDTTAVLSAVLTDFETGAPLSAQTIEFSVAGAPAGSAVTDASGTAAISYPIPWDAQAGEIEVTAYFGGSDPYPEATGAGTLTVRRGAVQITGLDRSGIIGTKVDLRAYLRTAVSRTALVGRTIRFEVNGTDVGTADTDATGRATLPYVVPGPAGTHPLGFVFDGDPGYEPASASGSLTATTSGTKMSLLDRTGNIAGDVWLKAYLWTNPGSQPLSGKTIHFSVSGTVVGSAETNVNGRAILRYYIPDGEGAGQRPMSAEFSGDGGYLPSSASATLTVERAPVYIWPYTRSVRQGQPLLLRAYVRRLWDYQWLPGRTINFAIDGTTVGTADTDVNGIAWFTFSDTASLAVGTHSFTTSFAGDAWVAPGSASGTFRVVAP